MDLDQPGERIVDVYQGITEEVQPVSYTDSAYLRSRPRVSFRVMTTTGVKPVVYRSVLRELLAPPVVAR